MSSHFRITTAKEKQIGGKDMDDFETPIWMSATIILFAVAVAVLGGMALVPELLNKIGI